ncbi:MAG: hypothetical protein H6Q08_2964 [Acidobacteria bacterium]|nr:hypothetical protein [Acidobacteriota bacterium]
MAWRERLREISETPWSPIGAPAALGGVVFILWILLQASTGDRWVPILDHANLAFHEAGHLIVGVISDTMAVYGGTIGQLVFPIATACTFWSRRNTLGFALCVAWGCESLLNIATYMGDARAMSLPLIGGLDPETHHDWREILTRWGMLDLDTAWADLNRGIAWTVGLWVCWWLARRFRSNG